VLLIDPNHIQYMHFIYVKRYFMMTVETIGTKCVIKQNIFLTDGFQIRISSSKMSKLLDKARNYGPFSLHFNIQNKNNNSTTII